MKQRQNSKQHTTEFRLLGIGFWNLFEICHLRFGNWR